MKNLLYITIGLFALSLTGCVNGSTNEDKEIADQPVDYAAAEKSPEAKPLSNADTIEVRGYIEVPPENREIISTYYGGYVKSLTLLKGQHVKKGQFLFALVNPAFLEKQQEYVAAKENFEFLEADYNRQKDLASENIASGKSFSKVEADYRSAESRYLSLKEQLKLMNIDIDRLEKGEYKSSISIYAPIEGMISMIDINAGQYLDEKERALEIINTNHLHLELEVFERDISKIIKGQVIQFSVPELSVARYNASVYLINTMIDPEKRTASIHAHIDEAIDTENFVPGMFVEAGVIIK